jgi:hypothetical protein
MFLIEFVIELRVQNKEQHLVKVVLFFQCVPFVIQIGLLIIGGRLQMTKMNQYFILDNNLPFQKPCKLVHGLQLWPPSFGWTLLQSYCFRE